MYMVSVIIPVYNNEKELELTLGALMNQNLKKDVFEVIVADDGSSHNMRRVVEKNVGGELNWKYLFQEDRGFRPGCARNMGIRSAEGGICLFLDCGVLPRTDCLQVHIDYHGRDYDVVLGYVYGMGKNPDLDIMRHIISSNSIEKAICMFRGMRDKDIGDGRDYLYEEYGYDLSSWAVPWIALWSLHFSVCTTFLLRNKIFFDEYFNTWGGEDTDFGINLHNHDAKFVLAREAESIHYPPAILSYKRLQTDPVFWENAYKNREYIYRKHFNNKSVELWYKNKLRRTTPPPTELL